MSDLVTNVMAQNALLQYKRVLPCIIIDKYQDWQFRQQFQYEAMKGLIADDFLSIDDFKTWMDLTQVSMAHKFAWKLVKPLVALAPKIKLTMLRLPGMGWVGRTVGAYSLAGFTKIFTSSTDILEDQIKSL